MYSWSLQLKNGSKISGLKSNSMNISAWYLLWSNLGADRAWQLIDLVQSMTYVGSSK